MYSSQKINIANATQAKEATRLWEKLSHTVQKSNLKQAIEKTATQFRIWATQLLKEYIINGFTLNDERFKTGSSMNYFTELQERIRKIRLSERFFYQKIKDIYTTSIDYDPRDEKTILFFTTIQNKLLWAISQQTAAELIYRRF